MTNAQNATWHAVKELLAPFGVKLTHPEPLYDGQYATVIFTFRPLDEDVTKTFLIEAGGCLARVYA